MCEQQIDEAWCSVDDCIDTIARNETGVDLPFWAVEYEYKKRKDNFEADCIEAKTLQDAIICGANMTYLDGEKVGYLAEDGIIETEEKYREKCLSDIEVEFVELGEDADGYTVAYYRRAK